MDAHCKRGQAVLKKKRGGRDQNKGNGICGTGGLIGTQSRFTGESKPSARESKVPELDINLDTAL